MLHHKPFLPILQEIEKAWKMVDAAHEKETRARETIQALKQEITNLTKLVEQGAGLTMGQDNRYPVFVFCVFLLERVIPAP